MPAWLKQTTSRRWPLVKVSSGAARAAARGHPPKSPHGLAQWAPPRCQPSLCPATLADWSAPPPCPASRLARVPTRPQEGPRSPPSAWPVRERHVPAMALPHRPRCLRLTSSAYEVQDEAAAILDHVTEARQSRLVVEPPASRAHAPANEIRPPPLASRKVRCASAMCVPTPRRRARESFARRACAQAGGGRLAPAALLAPRPSRAVH